MHLKKKLSNLCQKQKFVFFFFNVIIFFTLGIGANTALHLASLGGNIVLVDKNPQGLSDVVEQLNLNKSPAHLAIIADVTVAEDVKRIISETINHFGKLDVLVNSAGLGCEKTIMSATIDDFDQLMNTNLRSIVILTKLAIPYLEKSKGNIVNVSSISGIVPVKYAFYGMSKAALDHFTRSAANEFGPKGIRVNSVNPSFVMTPMLRQAFNADRLSYLLNKCKERYPIGRFAQLEDVSAAIAFLASDAASYVTGHQLAVDG